MGQREEPDDNTLDNAGQYGIIMADTMTEKSIAVIEDFPGPLKQKVAIARLFADNLYNWIEEND
jgi:hypothetical protein